MLQLSLFDSEIIKTAYLRADSPRCAFYDIWIESNCGAFVVRKKSGAGERVLDVRAWSFDSLVTAERFFERLVRCKTNPERRSPRKYRKKSFGRDCVIK